MSHRRSIMNQTFVSDRGIHVRFLLMSHAHLGAGWSSGSASTRGTTSPPRTPVGGA